MGSGFNPIMFFNHNYHIHKCFIFQVHPKGSSMLDPEGGTELTQKIEICWRCPGCGVHKKKKNM